MLISGSYNNYIVTGQNSNIIFTSSSTPSTSNTTSTIKSATDTNTFDTTLYCDIILFISDIIYRINNLNILYKSFSINVDGSIYYTYNTKKMHLLYLNLMKN